MTSKANVYLGEAPESDSEDELNISDGIPVVANLSTQGKIVVGEAPESDDETIGKSGSLDSISSAVSAASSNIGSEKKPGVSRTNTSLLTKKLCERNVSLAKNITDFMNQTVTNANNELNTVDQHILKCQINLQEASDILRALNDNVSKLDFKIQSLLSANYIPDIKIWKTESSH